MTISRPDRGQRHEQRLPSALNVTFVVIGSSAGIAPSNSPSGEKTVTPARAERRDQDPAVGIHAKAVGATDVERSAAGHRRQSPRATDDGRVRRARTPRSAGSWSRPRRPLFRPGESAIPLGISSGYTTSRISPSTVPYSRPVTLRLRPCTVPPSVT